MSLVPRLHRPTITGRLRTDPVLLLLIGLVVAITTALVTAVTPLTEDTADRAMAETVRDAGSRGALTATFPEEGEDRQGQARQPNALVELRQDADYARFTLPAELADVVRPGVTSVTTSVLHLLDAGSGRYLRLAFLEGPDGAPGVTYAAGGPPLASVGADQADVTVPDDADPWPVQAALSVESAAALEVGPGDRLPAEDPQHRPIEIVVSGLFVADDTADDAWETAPGLLDPIQGTSAGVERTSAAAIVSADALPDLRLAVPLDDLTQRVVFHAEPSQLRWKRSADLAQEVVSLKSSASKARGSVSWDSLLDRVLDQSRSEVATARGLAQVLLVGLLACAALVLVLAAQLLVRRRAGPVALARERGASLPSIGAELFVEALGVALTGAALGLMVTWLLVGDVGWRSSVPVVAAAALAGPLLGASLAAGSAATRRAPANRAARRTAARARRVRRLLLEALVLAAAGLSLVSLHQRGVLVEGDGSGDPTAASAPTWWAAAGALVLLRVLPPLARLALGRARRTTGTARFLVAARVAQTGATPLAVLVVTVTIAQLTFGVAMTATEQRGQAAGALLAVGGDARLMTAPAASVGATASDIASAPGVRAAVAARVVDGVRASSSQAAASVRLVVVDAAGYEGLLAATPLPDAPQLARLTPGDTGRRVPALLLGGDPGLADDLVVRWDEEAVPLTVVGIAPRVEAALDPVVVVDAAAFAATGAAADPGTVWAAGPGAAAAVRSAADPDAEVSLVSDVLASRRDAPLASGLVHLALASSLLLLLLSVLGVGLTAAGDAAARAESFGRLRSLGLARGELRRVLVGELLTPVLVGCVAGLLLGVGGALFTFGDLSLEQVTGQTVAPQVVVPWWVLLVVLVLVATVAAIARVESRRLRRTALSQLLRGGT